MLQARLRELAHRSRDDMRGALLPGRRLVPSKVRVFLDALEHEARGSAE